MRHHAPAAEKGSNRRQQQPRGTGHGRTPVRLRRRPLHDGFAGAGIVYVEDLESDGRWPQYAAAVRGHGFRSILALPFLLESDTLESDKRAALNLYSHRPGRFDDRATELARDFVHQTSMALRLAVHFAQSSETAAHLKATLETRTGIDIAVGIIMAQNRCSQDEAFELLKSASSARNVKLHVVAAGSSNRSVRDPPGPTSTLNFGA